MNQLMKAICVSLFISLLSSTALFPPQTHAAEFRSGEDVRLTDTAQPIDNPYIFGERIQIDSPVSNELTTAGGDITITGPIEGSALIAGGNITLRGPVGNNARIAGGNITIDGPIANDLVIAGGSITLTRNASIGGDLVFNGGTMTVDGPIAGKAVINGGEVRLNNTIRGDVSGNIEQLTLGSNAVINGNLSYKSPERAQIAQGAAINGRNDYQPNEDSREEDAAGFLTSAVLYKLIADIIISVLFIYFFRRALTAIINRMRKESVRSGAIGFGYLILVPIAGIFLLILIWLGISTFLFFALTYIIALYIMKVFLGWSVLHFWKVNQKKVYDLDWKAGVIGPIILFILSLIPILGWLTIAIIFLISLGALAEELIKLASNQRVLPTSSKVISSRKR